MNFSNRLKDARSKSKKKIVFKSIWFNDDARQKRWKHVNENVLYIWFRRQFFIRQTFYQKNLIKNFNDDNLFMRIKQNIKIFRTFVQKNVYIINKIISKFKIFALLTNNMMFAIKFFEILFVSFAISTIVNLNKILFDTNIDFRNNIEIDFQSSNVNSNVDSNIN